MVYMGLMRRRGVSGVESVPVEVVAAAAAVAVAVAAVAVAAAALKKIDVVVVGP